VIPVEARGGGEEAMFVFEQRTISETHTRRYKKKQVRFEVGVSGRKTRHHRKRPDTTGKILIKTCSIPTPDVIEIYEALNYKKRPFTRKKFVFPENKN